MPIVVNLDMMLLKRKMSLTELSDKTNISIVSLSMMKTGKSAGVRYSTLNEVCRVLQCKPGDILDYLDNEEFAKLGT